MLARNNGAMECVRSREPPDFQANAFVSKMGQRPVDAQLAATPAANFDLIYPLEEGVFPGSVQTWVGQYQNPGGQATLTVRQARANVPLPPQNVQHPQLP